MKTRRGAILCGLLVLQYFVSREGVALADCEGRFPGVDQGIHSWEARRQTTVSHGVAVELNSEFCSIADALKRERGVTEGQITGVAQRVAEKYLEAQVRRDGPGPPTLRASIGAELGLPGLARPRTPRWCVLKMVYDIAADRIAVDGEVLASAAEILVKPGTMEIKGYQGSSEVCSGKVTVDVPAGGTFHCMGAGK